MSSINSTEERSSDGSYLYSSFDGQSSLYSSGLEYDAAYNRGYQSSHQSPHVEQDVIYMNNMDTYCSESNVLGHPVPRTIAYDSTYADPWAPPSVFANQYRLPGDQSQIQMPVGRYTHSNIPAAAFQHTNPRGEWSNQPFSISETNSSRSNVPESGLESAVKTGGRKKGSTLDEKIRQNSQNVREHGGACFRCKVQKIKCSGETPCKKCSEIDGRKWSGCFRCFSEICKMLVPDILARRLNSEVLTKWVNENVRILDAKEYPLQLQVHFGFGPLFEGFRGYIYTPTTTEAERIYEVIHRDAHHPAEVEVKDSLPVVPSNSNSPEVRKDVLSWLTAVLSEEGSMLEWMRACFFGDGLSWVRGLLLIVWRYSMKRWNAEPNKRANCHLVRAWIGALLVTMLSLKITVSEATALKISRKAWSHRGGVNYPQSSRALSKSVKSLLFSVYICSVKSLAQSLDEFREMKSIPDIKTQHIGDVYCLSVLFMVITSQIQTSLMDNSQIARERNNKSASESSKDQLKNLDQAFQNTLMWTRWKRNEWFKQKSHTDYNNSELHRLRRNVEALSERDDAREEIQRHSKVSLRDLQDCQSFHTANTQRVFASFLNDVRQDKEHRLGRG